MLGFTKVLLNLGGYLYLCVAFGWSLSSFRFVLFILEVFVVFCSGCCCCCFGGILVLFYCYLEAWFVCSKAKMKFNNIENNKQNQRRR